MADERLKFLMQNFGGAYGGSGISSTLERSVTPDKTKAPVVAAPNVFDKITRVVGQTARIGAGVVGAAAKYGAHAVEDVAKSAINVGKTLTDIAVQPAGLSMANKTIDSLNEASKRVNDAYRSGKISKKDYQDAIKHIADGRKEINDKILEPIADGPSAGQRNADIAETAVNLLTLGRWSGIKATGEQAAKQGIDKLLTEGAGVIEKNLLRIPAAKELIARNTAAIATREAQRAAGETMEQYMVREGKRVAVGLLVKRPLFYQQNVQDATSIYNDMTHGKYGDALKTAGWVASQMVGGGPIGWSLKEGKKAGVKLRELSRGRDSLIDTLSSKIGDKTPGQITKYLDNLQKKSPEEFKKSHDTYRVMQETNLRVANEKVDTAAENILHTYDQAGIAREDINPKTFVDDYSKWHQAALITDGLRGRNIPGLDPEQVNNLVVVRWDSLMKTGLAKALQEVGDDKQAMTEVLQDFAGRTTNGWGNNPNLMKQLTRIIDESASADIAAKRIKAIPTATAMPDGLPKAVQKKLADLGYGVAVPLGGARKTPIVRLEDTRKLVTGAITGNGDLFDEVTAPQPGLKAIAGGLDKLGLSPQADNQLANSSLRQSLVAGLANTEVGRVMGFAADGDWDKGGSAVLSQLQRYVENKKPAFGLGRISSGKSAVTDVRMLMPNEIAQALGISASDAKEVQRVLIDAYTKVPLEIRGLGDRIVDYAFKYNPAHKYYSRIQSALRYTYNPFFRTQEQIETGILSKMNANKFLWMQPKEVLDQNVETLTRNGFFEGNLMSAAADDMVFGRISANMTKYQKRNLAGLAQTIADRKGLSLDDMIAHYPDELDDALRVVVQYPNKGVMASSLARTLNLAFFPMRYNAKVTMLAAKKIAELPPSLQLGVIQGFMKMSDWLKSDEGIRWQSENADAIQVFKWATPVGSIQSFYKLATGNVEAPGDLGLLGGLPFGMISQMLDSQGIIDLNTPYVDPSSGTQLPDYIPQTTKARAATAAQDLIGTMFSFPGRTLGLPGKEQTIRNIVDDFVNTNGKDFEKKFDTENLTPLQKNWIRVLKGDTSGEAIDALYTSPAEGQFNYYTLPPLDLPDRVQRVPGQVNVMTRTQVANQKPQSRGRTKRVARPIEQS